MIKNKKDEKLNRKILAIKISFCLSLLILAIWLLIVSFEAVWGQDIWMSVIQYVLAGILPLFVILTITLQALLYIKYKFKSDKLNLAFVFSIAMLVASSFIVFNNNLPYSLPLHDGPVNQLCMSKQSGHLIVCDRNGIY